MKIFLAWFAILGALALFLFSCLVTAADGQGAILFIFTFPALFLLLGCALALTRVGQDVRARGWKKAARWASRATLAFTLAFLICAFVPGLNLFTKAVVGGVSSAFQSVTGKTPYTWLRARNFSEQIKEALKASSGQKLDLSNVTMRYRWESVCILGPYTTDEAAVKVLKLSYEWKLSEFSKVNFSDDVNALVFLYGDINPSVLFTVDISRTQADFAKLSGQCFLKEKARFVKIPGEGTEFRIQTD